MFSTLATCHRRQTTSSFSYHAMPTARRRTHTGEMGETIAIAAILVAGIVLAVVALRRRDGRVPLTITSCRYGCTCPREARRSTIRLS